MLARDELRASVGARSAPAPLLDPLRSSGDAPALAPVHWSTQAGSAVMCVEHRTIAGGASHPAPNTAAATRSLAAVPA
jgi:hypothetical protein